jgi:hypothetical protein
MTNFCSHKSLVLMFLECNEITLFQTQLFFFITENIFYSILVIIWYSDDTHSTESGEMGYVFACHKLLLHLGLI